MNELPLLQGSRQVKTLFLSHGEAGEREGAWERAGSGGSCAAREKLSLDKRWGNRDPPPPPPGGSETSLAKEACTCPGGEGMEGSRSTGVRFDSTELKWEQRGRARNLRMVGGCDFLGWRQGNWQRGG